MDTGYNNIYTGYNNMDTDYDNNNNNKYKLVLLGALVVAFLGYLYHNSTQECETGYEKNTKGECVIKEQECKTGYEKNTKGECVIKEQECETGYEKNTKGECVFIDPLKPPIDAPCPAGQIREISYKETNGQCVDKPLSCNTGMIERGGKCVVDKLDCEPGTINVNNKCVKIGGKCIGKDANGHYVYEEDGTCGMRGCATGYEPGINDKNKFGCKKIVCKSGYYLDENQCIKTCGDGYRAAGDECILNPCPKGTRLNMAGDECVTFRSSPALICEKGTAIDPKTGMCYMVKPEMFAYKPGDKKLSFNNNADGNVCVPWRKDRNGQQLIKRINSNVDITGKTIIDIARAGDWRFVLPTDGSTNYIWDEFAAPHEHTSKGSTNRLRNFGKLGLTQCDAHPTKYVLGK